MFSTRSRFDLTPNRLALLRAELAAAGESVLDLTESNPTRCGFDHPRAEALAALADPSGLRYDPEPRGRLEARAAISAHYAGLGSRVDPARILVTASTSEAYAYLIKLLADDGEEVLVPAPSYPLFEYLAGLEGVLLKRYRLEYTGSGWQLDLDSVRAALGPRTRAILAVSPNNPTGSFLAGGELGALDALAGERGLALVVDEVFAEFPFADRAPAVSAVDRAERALTFSLSGLSKLCGMPQLKAGWIAAGGPAPLVEVALSRLELIADTYLSVATPVQLALPRLLAEGRAFRDQCRQRVRDNRAALAALVARSPSVELLAADAGWYACLRVPRLKSEEELCLELLRRDRLLVQPGYFFDFADESYLIVSLIVPTAPFLAGCRRLLERVAASPA